LITLTCTLWTTWARSRSDLGHWLMRFTLTPRMFSGRDG
jgi:hypothetical protein